MNIEMSAAAAAAKQKEKEERALKYNFAKGQVAECHRRGLFMKGML